MLLRKFAPDSVLRRIGLRRGLNILWAKPRSGDTPLYEAGGISGHAAGKTTFCRLLRWMLGEGNFGDDDLRESIRRSLPQGGCAAEVIVNGRGWLVWREFRVGGHSHCCPNRSLDDLFAAHLPQQPFDDYLAAVAELVPAEARSLVLPTSKRAIAWEHVLPWLSRDQECRFAKVLDWREPASESESPSVPAADRSIIVRVVLDTLAANEERMATEHAALRERHCQSRDRLPLLQHQARTDLFRLQEATGKALDTEAPELDVAGVIAGCETKLAELARQRDETQTNTQAIEAQNTLARATEARRAAQIGLEEDQRLLEIDRLTLKSLRGGVQADEEERWAALLAAPKGRCNVPLEVAKAKNCPLAKSRGMDFPTEVEIRRQTSEASAYEASIAAQEADLTQRRRALERLQTEEQAARAAFSDSLVQHNRRLWKLADEEHRLKDVITLARRAERAQQETRELPEKIAALDKDLRDSQEDLHDLRQQAQRMQSEFASTLEWIVQAVLGNDVKVGLDPRADQIRVTIEQGGERSSAAMRTVGVLAFDLAAVASACEGRGWHAGLLIHDSPREADLSPDIYRRFFLFVTAELEAAYGNAEPGFQYIITTTEPPPAQLRQPPWLLDLILDASTPEGRLLGINL